ncbi:hypothetical protein [Clostridium sp.]|uniref:hypothetical protein n=1 Tax=Clostridium sp. TaxID=1506 RepID=UPI001A4916CC|nr:hypothetical protein [Clostridium sp.]MBK5241006.1 hypothetical protein [Clostridium sp.]
MNKRDINNIDSSRQLCGETIFIVLMIIGMFSRQLKVTSVSGVESYFTALLLVALGFAIFEIIRKKYSRRELYIIAGILLFFCIIYIINGRQNEYLLINIIAIITVKSIEPSRFVKLLRNTYAILFFMLFVFLKMGLIENTSVSKGTSSGIWITCIAYGFHHSNTFYWMFYILVSSYVYCRFYRLKTIEIIIIISVSFYFYTTTFSRAGLFCIVMLLLFRWLLLKVNILKVKIIKLLCTYLYACLFLLSLVFSLVSNNNNNKNSLIMQINYWTTGRFTIAANYLQAYKLNFFGRDVTKTLPFDNMYMFVILSFGLVTAIILIILYTKLCRYLMDENLYAELCITIIFAVYSIFESQYTNVFYNYSIIFFGYLIYTNTKWKSTLPNVVNKFKENKLWKR